MMIMGGDRKKIASVIAGSYRDPAKNNEKAFNERAAEPSGDDSLLLEAANAVMKGVEEKNVKAVKDGLYAFIKACEVEDESSEES